MQFRKLEKGGGYVNKIGRIKEKLPSISFNQHINGKCV